MKAMAEGHIELVEHSIRSGVGWLSIANSVPRGHNDGRMRHINGLLFLRLGVGTSLANVHPTSYNYFKYVSCEYDNFKGRYSFLQGA